VPAGPGLISGAMHDAIGQGGGWNVLLERFARASTE
jgi:hypothetical protein